MAEKVAVYSSFCPLVSYLGKKRLKFYYKLCIIRDNCIDMQFMDKLIYKVVILLL